MPGYIRRVARLFDEEGGSPTQNIRPDDVLDGVENARMADQVVQPGEQQVRFLPEFPGERTGACLECLKPGPDLGGFGGGQHSDR